MKIHNALLEASSNLKTSPTPRLDAEVLLAYVLKKERSFLVSHSEKNLTATQEKKYQTLILERQAGKPVAYLRHQKEFYGRTFFVDERVLIPRPETELLVEEAVQFLSMNHEPSTILDLGTGSGCIGITIALERPDLTVMGLDISKEALAVAKKNAKRLGCRNIKFMESDLLLSLLRHFKTRNDMIIIANLPYIGTKKNRFIAKETLEFEPHTAIFGGPDGLQLYRRMFSQIKDNDLNVRAILLELGFNQADILKKEASRLFPNWKINLKNDLQGIPRIMILEKS